MPIPPRFRPAVLGLCMTLLTTHAAAQTLPRKPMLGAIVKPLDEATAKTRKLAPGAGLLVAGLAPGGSFEQMGIKVGDIVASVNRRPLTKAGDLQEIEKGLAAGDRLEVETIAPGAPGADAKPQSLQGVALARPLDVSPHGVLHYGAAGYALGTLRTITHVPHAKPTGKDGRYPAVFFLQGYSCTSQDSLPGSARSVKRLIGDWVKAGYLVFRFERPNMGDSRTTKDCRDTDFDEEMAATTAAYKALLADPKVDGGNVFLFGHSMGSNTAPLLAQTRQPKGVMAYGVVWRSWFEIFNDISRFQSTYSGKTRVESERIMRDMLPVYYAWLEQGTSPSAWRKDPLLKAALEAHPDELEISGDYVLGRHHRFWHTLNQKRMAQAWSRVEGKVLAIYGEFDLHAVDARDARDIAATVNESHPGNGEFLGIPGTEHGFSKAQSYREVSDLLSGHKVGNWEYNPEVGRLTLQWMDKVRKN